jgi:glycosyltransferase involved in cell wall biosynthesis
VADHFIAVSESVKENLVRHHEISEQEVTVIHGCIPLSASLEHVTPNREDEKPLVIVGCGVGVPRKGFDLLPVLMLHLSELPNMGAFELKWIGSVSKDSQEVFEHDIKTLGLDGGVTLIGEVEDPADLMSQAELFILPSREDPFPLVVLEAARSRLPIVCFDRAGGAPELVEDDAGVVVPYLNVPAMAHAIRRLAMDRNLRLAMGDRAYEKVRARYDVEVQAPKIEALLRRLSRR